MNKNYCERKIKRNIKFIGYGNLGFLILFWYMLAFSDGLDKQKFTSVKTGISGSIVILGITIIMMIFEAYKGWIEHASNRKYIALEIGLAYVFGFQLFMFLINIEQGINFLQVTSIFVKGFMLAQFMYTAVDFVVEKIF